MEVFLLIIYAMPLLAFFLVITLLTDTWRWVAGIITAMLFGLSALWAVNWKTAQQGVFGSLFLELATHVTIFAALIYVLCCVAWMNRRDS